MATSVANAELDFKLMSKPKWFNAIASTSTTHPNRMEHMKLSDVFFTFLPSVINMG